MVSVSNILMVYINGVTTDQVILVTYQVLFHLRELSFVKLLQITITHGTPPHADNSLLI